MSNGIYYFGMQWKITLFAILQLSELWKSSVLNLSHQIQFVHLFYNKFENHFHLDYGYDIALNLYSRHD